jgi:hypothetical protein
MRFGAFSLGLLVLQFAAGCGGKSDDEEGIFPSDAGAPGSQGGRISSTGGRPNIVTGSGGRVGSGGSNSASGGLSSADGGASDTDPPPTTVGGATSTDLTPGVCSNGLDDDDDGVIDGMDPECSGPYDNDEDTFATGIPGDNQDPKWQDCFFDGNSGAGDDGCRYHTDCLYGDAAQTEPECSITDDCQDFCQARTPNGCDCFGCCTVQDESGTVADIYITGTCSTENLDDTDACPRCTKSPNCENTCGRCELCPGKTEADLPEDCAPVIPPVDPPVDPPPGEPPPPVIDPPSYECENGRVCSETLPCSSGSYCHLGCCLITVF